jgi:hypothetical protein
MKLLRLLPLLLLFIDSCVEPFELKQGEFIEALVVDGMITDKVGPYMLTLKRSSPTSVKIADAPGVSGAIITLHDDEGNSVQYIEAAPGIYFTPPNTMQGTVGRSYHITIKLQGKEYASRPSTMMPGGTITSLYGKFEENVINFDDLTEPQDAIRIYFSSKGEPGFDNLYRWRWSGIYEVLTFPDLHMRAGPRGSKIPDPFPCSGLVFNGVMTRLFPCECCTCFMPEYNQIAHVSDNKFFQSGEFNDVLLATLPYEAKRFYFKYRIKLEQLSLDEESYEYWRLARAQQDGRTDIFQPNSIKMAGNIECITDPDERVLGIFSASAIAEETFDLPRGLNRKLLKPDTLIRDCREVYQGATNVRPPMW